MLSCFSHIWLLVTHIPEILTVVNDEFIDFYSFYLFTYRVQFLNLQNKHVCHEYLAEQ